MRIVHFTRKPRKIGNYSVEKVFELVRKKLSQKVCITVSQCKYYSTGFFRRLYNCIEAAFKQQDINHILGDVTYLAAFLRKKNTIITFLDCEILRRTKGLKHYLIKWIWFDMPIRKAILVTAISEATKKDLIHYTGCKPDKIRVIYVSISDMYEKVPKEFNSKCPRILQIGTAANKNIPRLIEALHTIPCILHIIGTLDEYSKFLLKKHHIKHTLNERKLTDDEVFEEYKKCDIVSFVSTGEGFGMPIIEANVVGRVVITGNTTSMPEVAGDAACIVDPFDVDSIREGLRKIINNKSYRDSLISKGYENSKRFLVQTSANQYYEIYQAIYNGTH